MLLKEKVKEKNNDSKTTNYKLMTKMKKQDTQIK
mgnify:CR=1 FL=1